MLEAVKQSQLIKDENKNGNNFNWKDAAISNCKDRGFYERQNRLISAAVLNIPDIVSDVLNVMPKWAPY